MREQQLDSSGYTYQVTWSEEDREFVAVCLELPSVSWLAETPEEALAGVRRVAANIMADIAQGS